jgi:SMODS and SLOG-associating 2TM effector domain 2
MTHSPGNWLQRQTPEDPRRISEFRSKLEGLLWQAKNSPDSLSAVFYAVDDLAIAEVRYYFRRRRTRAWISGATRIGAWVLATIGLLLPLLAGTADPMFKGWAQYGYVFLAAAGSCLAANSLFGGTDGHIRFVSTQLELEKLITYSRIVWCKYLAGCHQEEAAHADGFDLILAYANALHVTTIAETGRWGDAILAELARYQKSTDVKPPK